MSVKVLLVVASIGGGGAERVAVQLASYFSSLGLDVHICYWNKKVGEYLIPDKVDSSLISSKNRLIGLARVIDNVNPDVMISFTDIPNVIGYFSKLLLNANIVHIPTVHSDLKARDSHLDSGIIISALSFLHKYVCRNSEKVVSVSKGAMESLEYYYNLSKSKSICIYNPVLDGVGVKPPQLGRDSKSLRIVSAGRLTLAKNYPLIIEVARKLKDYKYKFTIDIYGSGELESDLREMIRINDLDSYVFLRGFSSNFSEELSTFDLFLMTSTWEGFGNVLVEALDKRLDIISTDCPSGPSEILDNGKFGTLVPAGCATSIFQHIINETYRKNYTEESLQRHLSNFTLPSVGAQYLSLISELLKEN